MNKIQSKIVGPGLISPVARLEYRALTVGAPITLRREPDNPVDPNAIIALTFLDQPCGYIPKKDAAYIAPQMDAGVRWDGKVTAKQCAMHPPLVLLRRKTR